MDAKTLLGIGAIGGAVYLATSKKAQAKVKKTAGLSDGNNKISVSFYNDINKDLMSLSPKNKVKSIQRKLANIVG
jgi:uncharacterized membrane protein